MMRGILFYTKLLLLSLASSRLLPPFSVLKANYPGHSKYGGTFPDEVFLEAIGLKGRVEVNDTCPLRVSTMLNLISGQAILQNSPKEESINGTGGLYYFPTAQGLSFHLDKVYCEPVAGTLESFKGVSGIMIPVNISNPQSCHALLWNGLGFHQVRGFVKRTNVSWIRFWQAPSEACTMNVNVKKDSACFTSQSTVQLSSGMKKAMKDLAIDDEVLTYTFKGKRISTKILSFIHQDPGHIGQFYSITTEYGYNILISEAHLIFKVNEATSGIKSVYASRLKPGDFIYVQSQTSHDLTPVKIVRISFDLYKGAFAPITSEGTLIVDGVWVSCYADLSDHRLAHSLMAPLRFLYSVAPKWLGSKGPFIHKHLKNMFHPFGVRLLGKEKFYDKLQANVMKN